MISGFCEFGVRMNIIPVIISGSLLQNNMKKIRMTLHVLLYLSDLAVGDPRGVPWCESPYDTKFSRFHGVFGKKLTKSYVDAPLEGRHPLLQGILDLPLLSNHDTSVRMTV